MTEESLIAAAKRPGIYARGSDTVEQILAAALRVLIEEGASAFTLRRVAAECGMKVGNLSYHFPKKQLLIQLLLGELLISYEGLLDRTVRIAGLTPEDRLVATMVLCMDDILTKRTTHLFTELWALANHDPFVADKLSAFYAHVHGIIGQFVAELNPSLDADEVMAVALYISASMEGMTPFAGHGKTWEAQMPRMKAMATTSLVQLAKTVTSQDIRYFDAPDQSRAEADPD
jgi:AcrR family transcriptional regulator